MDLPGLTKRQQGILDFIVQTVEQRGYPPSVREIGEAVGLTSPSTVHAHLQTLEQRGYLRRDPSKPRAIEVCWNPASGMASGRPLARTFPIYGSIAAGPTSLAEQVHEGILAVPKEFVDDTPHFVLRVRGDSMVGAGILDEDLAIVRVNAGIANGDIVAAQITGPTGEAEATIKRLRRERGKTLLVPENPDMEPMEAPSDLHILGKVVALMRRL